MSYIKPSVGDIIVFTELDEFEDQLTQGKPYTVILGSWDIHLAILDDERDERTYPLDLHGYEDGYRFNIVNLENV